MLNIYLLRIYSVEGAIVLAIYLALAIISETVRTLLKIWIFKSCDCPCQKEIGRNRANLRPLKGYSVYQLQTL